MPNKGGKIDQVDLEQRLREMLEVLHRGRENAMPRAELCNIFPEVGERTLRHLLKHLLNKHGCPIGSCKQGYFWAITPGEIEEVCQYWKGYALSSLQNISNLKRIPVGEVCQQLGFELESK